MTKMNKVGLALAAVSMIGAASPAMAWGRIRSFKADATGTVKADTSLAHHMIRGFKTGKA